MIDLGLSVLIFAVGFGLGVFCGLVTTEDYPRVVVRHDHRPRPSPRSPASALRQLEALEGAGLQIVGRCENCQLGKAVAGDIRCWMHASYCVIVSAQHGCADWRPREP